MGQAISCKRKKKNKKDEILSNTQKNSDFSGNEKRYFMWWEWVDVKHRSASWILHKTHTDQAMNKIPTKLKAIFVCVYGDWSWNHDILCEQTQKRSAQDRDLRQQNPQPDHKNQNLIWDFWKRKEPKEEIFEMQKKSHMERTTEEQIIRDADKMKRSKSKQEYGEREKKKAQIFLVIGRASEQWKSSDRAEESFEGWR